MREIILLAGLPGSGKSTIARHLAEMLGVELVGVDRFKREVVDPKSLSEGLDPPDVRWQYYQRALQYVFGLFEQGARRVIVDEMFHVGALREKVEGACAEQGIPVRWIEVCCSDEVVEQRLIEHPREGHILTTEQLRHIRRQVAEAYDNFPSTARRLAIANMDSVDAAVRASLAWICRC